MNDPIATSPSSALPGKVELLVRLLGQELRRGAFAAGQRFYSTRALVAQYGVSVGTAQKALAALVQEGLLESVQGSGFYVRQQGVLTITLAHESAGQTPLFLVVIELIGQYGVRLLDEYLNALRERCQKYGWELVTSANTDADIARAIKGRPLAGCLAYGLVGPLRGNLNPASVVVWNGAWYESHYAMMTVDGPEVARIAFEHLLDLGHVRIALVRRKLEGYHRQEEAGVVLGMRKSYTAMGLTWQPEDVIDIDDNQIPGLYQGLLDRGYTGIYCSDWEIGAALGRQARERGEAIGDRLSIVFSGGSDLRTQLDPLPTRVYWRFADFAAQIVDGLHNAPSGIPLPHRMTLNVFLEPGRSATRLVQRGA